MLKLKGGNININLRSHQPRKTYILKDDSMQKIIKSNEEFFSDVDEILYSPKNGLNFYKQNMYTDFIHDNSNILFKIIEQNNINYAIFAGSSVGYIRDKKNMVWLDDYDLMVFDKDIQLCENLKNNKILDKNGFKITSEKNNAGIKIFNNFKTTPFLMVDIFYSKLVDNKIYNLAKWGLYHRKEMNKEVVFPFKRINLGGLNVYGVNNPELEVSICYGDINKGILSTHYASSTIIADNWKILDDFFKNSIQKGIENIKLKLNHHSYSNKINIFEEKFQNIVEALKFIADKKVKTLNIFNQNYLELYVYDIKYYFPQIIINYYHITSNIVPAIYLNKCNNIFFKCDKMLKYYDSNDIIYLQKPTMQLITLITFGTFDLFHIGHKNIFDFCSKYSDNIVVGLSSDNFTYEKKNIYPTDNFETRKDNIITYCNKVTNVFLEEKMKLKNEYVNDNNANLMIMGDDWKGAFDYIDCAVFYKKRTPNISSTILRNITSKNDFVDKVIYINLDERKDRKEQIEKETSIFPSEKVQRFSAIKHTNGNIGCSKSHIAVLELAIKNKWKNLLVLEDDMLWDEQFDEQLKILEQKLSQPYDVIVLGGMLPHYDKKTLKLTKCYGTGAYIVNSSYYETLLNNFKEGLEKLENYHYSSPKNQFIWNKQLKKQYTEEFNLDNYWNRLQLKDNWFIVQMMYSKEDYSDIEKSNVNYLERYKM